MTHLGDIIYTLRYNAKMTCEELACKADVSHSFVSKLEATGKAPSMRTLNKLAKALNVTASWLISQSEKK